MTQQTLARELNLTVHREPVSVWDRRGWDGTRARPTVARWLVGAGGAALALQGARRRSLTGATLTVIGGGVAIWALSGEGDFSEVRHWVRETLERVGWRRQDLVSDASADSFPASDAPAWTPTVGTGVRRRAR